MKILFVGGGSGGPVTPLLAVAEEIKKTKPKSSFLYVGTKKGPERVLAEEAGIDFISLPSGKWRRYFSLKNIFTPFWVIAGFIKSFRILKKHKPRAVFGTGSFVQVPLIWAAWLLKIPCVVHQQDYLPSLANSLCQIPAKKITVTFKKSLKDFSGSFGLFYKKKVEEKVVLTGNPFRDKLKFSSRENGLKVFNLKKDFPTLLVLGGGTGAKFLNELIKEALPELSKIVQIIHITGKGKLKTQKSENYYPLEFTSKMAEAYSAADIVLARAGLSTITELSVLKKVAIIVPMPNSHQEANAVYLMQKKAAVVIPQKVLNKEVLIKLIRRLLFEHLLQNQIKKNISEIMPSGAANQIAKIILGLIK